MTSSLIDLLGGGGEAAAGGLVPGERLAGFGEGGLDASGVDRRSVAGEIAAADPPGPGVAELEGVVVGVLFVVDQYGPVTRPGEGKRVRGVFGPAEDGYGCLGGVVVHGLGELVHGLGHAEVAVFAFEDESGLLAAGVLGVDGDQVVAFLGAGQAGSPAYRLGDFSAPLSDGPQAVLGHRLVGKPLAGGALRGSCSPPTRSDGYSQFSELLVLVASHLLHGL